MCPSNTSSLSLFIFHKQIQTHTLHPNSLPVSHAHTQFLQYTRIYTHTLCPLLPSLLFHSLVIIDNHSCQTFLATFKSVQTGAKPPKFTISIGSHHYQVAILVPGDKLDCFVQSENFFRGKKCSSFLSGTSAAT